jgi:predicted site-specific integrase-resolvase
MPEMITTSELAERWGVSTTVLQKWRARGTGPAYIKIGKSAKGTVRYSLADIVAYEQRQRSGTDKPGEAAHV